MGLPPSFIMLSTRATARARTRQSQERDLRFLSADHLFSCRRNEHNSSSPPLDRHTLVACGAARRLKFGHVLLFDISAVFLAVS